MEFNIDYRERADARFYEDEEETLHDLDVLAAAFAMPQSDSVAEQSSIHLEHMAPLVAASANSTAPSQQLFAAKQVNLVENTAVIHAEPSMRRYKRNRGSALLPTAAAQRSSAPLPSATRATDTHTNASTASPSAHLHHIAHDAPPSVPAHSSTLRAPPPPPTQTLVRLDSMFTSLHTPAGREQPDTRQRKVTSRSRVRAGRGGVRPNAAFQAVKLSSGVAQPRTLQLPFPSPQQQSTQLTSISSFFSQAIVQPPAQPQALAASGEAPGMQQTSIAGSNMWLASQSVKPPAKLLQAAPSLPADSGVSLANLFSQFTAQGKPPHPGEGPCCFVVLTMPAIYRHGRPS